MTNHPSSFANHPEAAAHYSTHSLSAISISILRYRRILTPEPFCQCDSCGSSGSGRLHARCGLSCLTRYPRHIRLRVLSLHEKCNGYAAPRQTIFKDLWKILACGSASSRWCMQSSLPSPRSDRTQEQVSRSPSDHPGCFLVTQSRVCGLCSPIEELNPWWSKYWAS